MGAIEKRAKRELGNCTQQCRDPCEEVQPPAMLDEEHRQYGYDVRILTSPKYRGAISEIRIEGHTSSDWTGATSPDDAYLHNMELSQARTRSTLLYVLMRPQVRGDVDWLRRLVTANGLSSSRPILDASGKEDAARSRRVEFKIRTDAETRIARILQVTR